MVHRYENTHVTWYDLLNPTLDEIREIITECNLPPSFAADMTSMTPRNEVLAKKGAIKLTFDYPIVKRTDITHPHEIKLIATKSALVTVRFEDIDAIHSYIKQFEVDTMLSNTSKLTGNILLALLISYLYDSLDKKLDYIETKLNDIDQGIFREREREMVNDISDLGRRIISFRHTISSYELILEQLEPAYITAFGKTSAAHIATLPSSFDHMMRRVRTIQRTLDELRETNTALLTTKQNEVMKLFTILAFITFPLTLFTSMFGMNTVATPIVGIEDDFWIILGIMFIVSVGFFGFFKFKDWI